MITNTNTAVPLTDLSCLQIQGSDARSYLQSQLTIDVSKMKQGQSRLGAYCEPKGRVITTFILAYSGETFLMLVPTVLKDTVLATLLRYRFRAKAEFVTTDEVTVHGCYRDTDNTDACVAEAHIRISHPLDQQRFFVLQPRQKTSGSTSSSSHQSNWQMADINVCMVWLDQRTTTRHLPQSLGLIDQHGVDFDKGCYPGQEIIARLKYLGQSKYSTYKFEAALDCKDLPLADSLRDLSGKRLGQRLNSVCYQQKSYGLVVISHAGLNAPEELHFLDKNENRLGKAGIIERFEPYSDQ